MKEDLVLIEVFSFYTDRSYLVYDCKIGSFQFTGNKISTWKVFLIIQVILI